MFLIWASVPKNECNYSDIKAYWLDFHKLIYITFKFYFLTKTKALLMAFPNFKVKKWSESDTYGKLESCAKQKCGQIT
jgi:hypothetical protein